MAMRSGRDWPLAFRLQEIDFPWMAEGLEWLIALAELLSNLKFAQLKPLRRWVPGLLFNTDELISGRIYNHVEIRLVSALPVDYMPHQHGTPGLPG